MRPASGALTRRIAVPAARTRPSSSGVRPRALTKAGRNGEATPYAAYIAAYSRMNLGSGESRSDLATHDCSDWATARIPEARWTSGGRSRKIGTMGAKHPIPADDLERGAAARARARKLTGEAR